MNSSSNSLKSEAVVPPAAAYASSDSDSDDVCTAEDWGRRIAHVQEQMRVLAEQIQVLVNESAARKRRKADRGRTRNIFKSCGTTEECSARVLPLRLA